MKKGLAINTLIILTASFISLNVNADSYPELIVSDGTGRIEIVTDYLLFSRGRSYEAIFPKKITSGSIIPIRYNENNQVVEIQFTVAEISAKDNLCRLHSKLRDSSSDTVYIKPCKYK